MNMARRALWGGGFIFAYVALDWVSFIHQFSPLGITPWNPPPGLALAAMLVVGPVIGPLVFLSAFLADVLVRDLPAPLAPTLLSAAVIALVYGLLAHLLRRSLHFDASLARLKDVFLLILGAAVAAAVVAFLYVGIFTAAGLLPPDDFVPAVVRFWIGDVIGIIVTAPPFLALRRWQGVRPSRRVVIEAAVQLAVLAAVLWLVFGLTELPPFRLFYVLFLPLIWIAVRFGIEGAAWGNLMAQVGLIVAFQAVGHASTTVTAFQFLMLALACTTLVLGIAISERRQVEAVLHTRQIELAQVSRLSMAGEMAAALAHELNQPLLAVIAFTRAAQRLLAGSLADGGRADGAKAAGAMDRAVAEAQRAGDIIRALREFIGTERTSRDAQAPARLLADALSLVLPECARNNIRLAVAVDKALPAVHVDKVQVQQVVLNLVRNAMDALIKAGTGDAEISIAARAVETGLEIEVRDNGPGVAPEVAERLFEPFNTSKPTGMGLGLLICRSFVEAHGGRLWLATNGPEGASFRFTLPVAEDVRETLGKSG
jgi:two-component system sensor kinase FixL